MADPVRRRALATALILGASFAGSEAASAQVVPFDDNPPQYAADGSFAQRLLGGMNKPKFEPQGEWAEVIMANSRWIVLQDANGRQYPLSFDRVGDFFVRWPSGLGMLSPDALLEITGVDLGSNRLSTNHIDVYEGAERVMVTPTMLRLLGAGRVITPLDVDQAQTYGAVYPFLPSEAGMPARIHVVGSVLNVAPLRVGVTGNNWVEVNPSDDGIGMTQVTKGLPSHVKKGDLVYYLPTDAETKSLRVARLILYKTMPFRAFNANANANPN